MNIGIDCRVFENNITGIGNYLIFLLKHLFFLDKKNKYFLFYRSFKYDLSFIQKNNNVTCIKVKSRNIFLEFFLFPFYIFKYNLDIFFVPSNYGVPFFKIKSKLLVTVHDLNPMKISNDYWKHYKFFQKKIYFFKQSLTIKKADKIICVSKSTKEDIFYFFSNIFKNKINVIYNASCLLSNKSDEEIFKKYEIKKDYIIHVTGHSLYKNTDLVIEAFNLIKEKYENLQLVIVGKTYERYKKEKEIIFTEMINDTEYSSLLSHAKMLIFISKYEGFGLPILEALNCGIPIIAFKTKVNEEIFGNIIYYIENETLLALSDMVEKVLHIELNEKEKNKFIEFSKKFTWEKSAKETLNVINSMERL